MHHTTQKRLDRYFDNPPLTDYLSLPTAFHPGVLGCSIENRLAAQLMLLADRIEADQNRRSAVRKQRHAFAGELAEEIDAEPQGFVQEPEPVRPDPHAATPRPRRNARCFEPAELRGDPLHALTKAQRDAKINVYRYAAKIMCQEADWDENLLIAGPKIIDQLLYMTERLAFSVAERQRDVAAKLKALTRETLGDEIPIQQIEQAERQMKGLRVQQRHFELMGYAFRQQRDPIVEATGIDWPRYEGLKARAERSAQAWRSKNRQRTAHSMVIENMSDAEYRRWVASTTRYEPRRNGVEASDEEGTAAREAAGE